MKLVLCLIVVNYFFVYFKSEEDTTPPNQAISQSAAAELLRQYIWDTIVAYDKDKSGSLESEELYEMLTVMNLGFTESDVEDIKVEYPWQLSEC